MRTEAGQAGLDRAGVDAPVQTPSTRCEEGKESGGGQGSPLNCTGCLTLREGDAQPGSCVRWGGGSGAFNEESIPRGGFGHHECRSDRPHSSPPSTSSPPSSDRPQTRWPPLCRRPFGPPLCTPAHQPPIVGCPTVLSVMCTLTLIHDARLRVCHPPLPCPMSTTSI